MPYSVTSTTVRPLLMMVHACIALYENDVINIVGISKNSLVISSSYQATHILPVVGGRLDSRHCKRWVSVIYKYYLLCIVLGLPD